MKAFMNGLEMNKIAASVLLAGVVAMTAGIVTSRLIYPDPNAEAHHAAQGAEGSGAEGTEHAAPKRGYTIPGAAAFEAGAAGAGPAAEEKPANVGDFMQSADAAKGEAVTKKCTACHGFDKGGANKVGPNLYGILGAAVAHKADYDYSQVFKDAHGKGDKWEYQHLFDYLANPKKVMPGTKMAFAGISKPEERANLIAYLRSLSDSPMPLPPKPAADAKPAAEVPTAAAATGKAPVAKEDGANQSSGDASPADKAKVKADAAASHNPEKSKAPHGAKDAEVGKPTEHGTQAIPQKENAEPKKIENQLK